MQAYVELIPPTAVTHAVALPFLHSQSEELVIAKTSLLQIFQVRHKKVRTASKNQTGISINGNVPDTTNIEKKLCLVGEFQLAGAITSLARIRALNTRTGGEALLVSFRDAKISLLEWNPESHGIATLSIHYYETEDLLGSPWAPSLRECSSYLVKDPDSRCAALKFGLRHLALIPFRQPGDDLTMGDYDPAIDDTPPSARQTGSTSTSTDTKSTPYESSFVLLLTELDPNIIYLADLAFLYEYREPTLGVLSSAKSPSLSIANDRKDIFTYTAFTLDLQQRASTALISVTGLPSDLFRVLPLPLPVGGVLLVGGNELIHVDQAGKTHAVAVNEFARQASNFAMTDLSNLALRLEGSTVSQINLRGDVLLILISGDFVMIKFRLDGRSVSGFDVELVAAERGGHLFRAVASCTARLNNDILFVGSEQADSVLVDCRHGRAGAGKKRNQSNVKMTDDAIGSDEEIEDEDDLYGEDIALSKVVADSAVVGGSEHTTFSILDSLPNFTASGEPVFGRKRKRLPATPSMTASSSNRLEMAIATGCDRSSNVALLNSFATLENTRALEIERVDRVWTLSTSPSLAQVDPDEDMLRVKYLITSGTSEEESARSEIYTMSGIQATKPTESYFESDASTLDAGMISTGKRIVQVCPGEVRCYPLDLSFPQIFPMTDEATEADLKVQHSSILDPYVLIIRDNGSSSVLRADTKGELDELETGKALHDITWASGCLHVSQKTNSPIHAYFLSTEGSLQIYALPELSRPVYTIEHLNLIPPTVGPGVPYRRSANREKLVEVLVTDLGDENVRSTHLVLRTVEDAIIIYQPFNPEARTESNSCVDCHRWTKVFDVPGSSEDEEEEAEEGEAQVRRPLRIVEVNGYQAVFLPSASPALIFKEATSVPRLLQMGDVGIVDVASFHTDEVLGGMVLARGKERVAVGQLPRGTRYGDIGRAVRRVPQHQQVEALCYHAESDTYAVCINEPSDFTLPEDDDWHPEWAKEDIIFKPQTSSGKVRLLDPKSGSIISEVSIEEDEVILCAKTIDLETSEITHEKRNLVVVGTAVMRGEDQPSNGGIYVYDVIPVVPDPSRPETDRSLKLLVREEVKGAVTSLTGIGDDGYVLVAQGQKLMVRGLKEDQTLLPVAFLDVQTQVTSLKNVKGTGLALMADALKGIWLVGFASDPFRMRLFGKSRSAMQTVAAEMLSYERQLFALVADTNCDLHVLEFNPEDPKSLSGQRLLNRSTFHTGQFPTALLALPSQATPVQVGTDDDVTMTNGDQELPRMQQSVLMTTQSGVIALITPLDEQTYRRLGALQNHLNSSLEHPCGLNPRAFRAADNEGFGGRGVLDGQVLMRWHMLSSQRKAEACARVGAAADLIRADLAMICGGGLDYF